MKAYATKTGQLIDSDPGGACEKVEIVKIEEIHRDTDSEDPDYNFIRSEATDKQGRKYFIDSWELK